MSIVLDSVSKAYGQQPVVNNLSLEIEAGELFVMLGASGSGKSTLLRLIAGLIPLDQGRIWLHGRDVTALPPQIRNTGFVFQNYSLFPHMNVADNIEFGLSIRHIPRAERQQRVAELLSLIGLEAYEHRLPSQLSGGQLQRVALARALAYQPEVLLLDEPFGALDAKIRGQLRQSLRDIQKKLKITTILVTHDQEEAFELADRLGILEQGQLLEIGSPTDLYRHPQRRFTAMFLGNANLLAAQRNSHRVYLSDVSLVAPPNTDQFMDQPVAILARPEEIALSPSADTLRGQPIGRGVVQEVTFAGPMEKASIFLPGISSAEGILIQALLDPDEACLMHLAPGQEIWVGLKHFHLMAAAEVDRLVPDKALAESSAS